MAEDPKCDKVTFFKPTNKIGGTVTSGPCDSEVLKLPQELREPEGVQPGFEPKPSLRPVSLGNRRQVLRCAEQFVETTLEDGEVVSYPSEGNDVVVEENTFTATVDLTSIPELSAEAEAYIIASNGVGKLEEAIVYAQEVPEAVTLALMLRIKLSQAERLRELLTVQLDILDAAAVNAGRAQLVCLWWNDTQRAQCSDIDDSEINNDDYASEEEDPEAVNLAVVIEKTVSSTESKTTANTIAYQQALALLNCFFLSDPTTVSCTTRPGRPLPTMELVPVDTPEAFKEEYGDAPNFDELPLRVGRASAPRGKFKSFASKADANGLAEQYVLAQLVCYYLSKEVQLQCDDPEARSQGADPRYTEAREADPVEGIPGQLVRIPAGYFTSDISTGEATAMAEALAAALLECCFINDEQLYTCPEGADPDKSPVYSYFVPRGTFESCTSKAEAEAIARASAEGALVCEYCNGLVPPSCVPAWVLAAATTGYKIPPPPAGMPADFEYNGRTYTTGDVLLLDLPLDVEGLIDPITRALVDLSSWSEDATRGMGASLICGPDKDQADQIAENAARMPVYVNDKGGQDIPSCRFKSTRHLIGCAFPDPFKSGHTTEPLWRDAAFSGTPQELYEAYENEAGDFAESLAPYTYKMAPTDTREAYVYYAATPYRNISVEYSSPTPGDYIDFPEGLLTMTAADLPNYSALAENLSLEEAERLVKEYADACVLQMGLGMLECNYKNPETVIACRYNPSFPTYPMELSEADYRTKNLSLGDPSAPYWWFGIGSTELDAYLLPENLATVANPIIIPSGAIVGKDYAEIKARIVTMATSLLRCQYTNKRVTCVDRGEKDNTCSCSPNIKISISTEGYAVEKGTVVARTVDEATKKAMAMLLCPGDSMCLCCNEAGGVTSYLAGADVKDEDCSRTKNAPECMFTASSTAQANAMRDAYLGGAAMGGIFQGGSGLTCNCTTTAPPGAIALSTKKSVSLDGVLFSAPCDEVRNKMQSAWCAAVCGSTLYANAGISVKLNCELKSSCFDAKTIPLRLTLEEGVIVADTVDVYQKAEAFGMTLLEQACDMWKEALSVFECTEYCVLTYLSNFYGLECPNGTTYRRELKLNKKAKQVSVLKEDTNGSMQVLTSVSLSALGELTSATIPIFDTASATTTLDLSSVTLNKTYLHQAGVESQYIVTEKTLEYINKPKLASWHTLQSVLTASSSSGLTVSTITSLTSTQITGLSVTGNAELVTFQAYTLHTEPYLAEYSAIASLDGLSAGGYLYNTTDYRVLDPDSISISQKEAWVLNSSSAPVLDIPSALDKNIAVSTKQILTDVEINADGTADINISLQASSSIEVITAVEQYDLVTECTRLTTSQVEVLADEGEDITAWIAYCCENVRVFKPSN
jgi:hypothetical protein